MEVKFQFRLSEKQKEQWFEFWNNCRHSYARQHYIYGEVERAKGRIPIYVIGQVNGRLVCIAIFSIRPLFFGNKFSFEAYCLRGPAFDDISFFKEFIQLVITQFRQLHIGSIRISPYWQFPEAEGVESLLNRFRFVPYYQCGGPRTHTGLIDLRPSEDEIFGSFSKKTRKEIRKAERSGVEIRPIVNKDETLDAFRCLSGMQKKRGLTPMSLSEFNAAFQYTFRDKEYGILFNAFLGKKFLGTRWLMRGPNIGSGAGYAIDTEACEKLERSVTVGYLLWWRGMQWAKKKGCLWLDVEGYRENTEKSDFLYQIYKFKRKFCPRPIQIVSEYIYVCSPVIYAAYKGYDLFLRTQRFVKALPYKVKNRSFFSFRKSVFEKQP